MNFFSPSSVFRQGFKQQATEDSTILHSTAAVTFQQIRSSLLSKSADLLGAALHVAISSRSATEFLQYQFSLLPSTTPPATMIQHCRPRHQTQQSFLLHGTKHPSALLSLLSGLTVASSTAVSTEVLIHSGHLPSSLFHGQPYNTSPSSLSSSPPARLLLHHSSPHSNSQAGPSSSATHSSSRAAKLLLIYSTTATSATPSPTSSQQQVQQESK